MPAGSARNKTQLPTRDDLSQLLANTSSPVKDPKSAKAYLQSKSWYLQEEDLSFDKLSRILLTASLIKGTPTEVQTVIKAVAYSLEDASSSSFAELIASKAIAAVSDSLSQRSEFLSAIAKDQTETLLKAKEINLRNTDLIDKLDSLHSRSLSTTSSPHSSTPTWAQIASNMPPFPASDNGDRTLSLTTLKTQQRLALAARRVLVDIDPTDPVYPKDCLPETANSIRDKINPSLSSIEVNSGRPPKIKALSILENRGLLLEMAYPEDAAYILDHPDALSSFSESPTIHIRRPSYPIILRFVPCSSELDITDQSFLQDLADEAEIPMRDIISVSWAKPPHLRSASQKFANLKVALASPTSANTLLTKRIRVYNHVVTAHKDIREPTRCNKCQKFGHIKNKCPNREICSTCASPSHPSSACMAQTTPPARTAAPPLTIPATLKPAPPSSKSKPA
jgi:hypothetical protein